MSMTVAQQHDLLAAETRIIHTMQTRDLDYFTGPCRVCGTGRVKATVLARNAMRQVIQSEGKCSTPGCLEWHD